MKLWRWTVSFSFSAGFISFSSSWALELMNKFIAASGVDGDLAKEKRFSVSVNKYVKRNGWRRCSHIAQSFRQTNRYSKLIRHSPQMFADVLTSNRFALCKHFLHSTYGLLGCCCRSPHPWWYLSHWSPSWPFRRWDKSGRRLPSDKDLPWNKLCIWLSRSRPNTRPHRRLWWEVWARKCQGNGTEIIWQTHKTPVDLKLARTLILGISYVSWNW